MMAICRTSLQEITVSAMLVFMSRAVSIYFLLFWLFVGPVTPQTVCPTQCACRNVTVDCRFRSLSSVADVYDLLPQEAEELDLGDNTAISAVNRTSFPLLTRMRRLRLDGCRLRRIESRTFENLQNRLELLDLSGNLIETLERDAFDGLRSLRRLRLDDNRVTGSGIPDSAFHRLSLSELRLDSNRLDNLSSSVFNDSEIVSINLDDNELSSIDGATLRPVQRTLRVLSISRNRGRTLRIAADAFHNFMFRDLAVASSGLKSLSFLENLASVEVLDVGGNPLGSVQLSWSSGLALSCREVRLAAINLTSVADAQLSSFRSARRIDLSANRISGALNAGVFRSVPDLRHLDLSRNYITRLPRDLGIGLSQLDLLNLSANMLTDLNAAAFSGAHRLSIIDVSYNRIQVLGDGLVQLFNSLTFVMLAGNPLHCNCELRWFRHWLTNDTESFSSKVLDSADILCVSPPNMTGPMSLRDEAEFICRAPRILRTTPSLVVNESSAVMLSCLAEADPAPEVVWRSPTNDRIGVSPPSDRKRTRTHAFWELRNVPVSQSGWYSSNATNLGGSQTSYTYLHVATPGDPPVDLSGLQYPMIPQQGQPETAITVSVTSSTFRFNVTSSSHRSTDRSRTTGSEFSTTSGARVTSAHARWTQAVGTTKIGDDLTTVDSLYFSTEPPFSDNIWNKVLLIVGCVVGGLVLLFILFIAVICCVRLGRKYRRRRRRTKSVPPAPRTIRDDCIRRPKPFPGISMADQADGQALQTPALPISPPYGRPEGLDLLSTSEYDRSCEELHTFDRRRNGNGANGST